MRFRRLQAEWDEDNVEHISRHGVLPEEVEEIVYEDCHPSRIVRIRRRRIPESRWRCSGKRVTAGISSPLSPRIPNVACGAPLTARDMTAHTKRRYQQWRKS